MGTYILQRLLSFIPTLLLATIITFTISKYAPGDPVDLVLGGGGERAGRAVTPAQREAVRRQLHLDQPVYLQYAYWLGDLAQGNMGVSLKDKSPVIDKIMERVPITILMGFISVVLAYLIAIPIGIHSATHQGSTTDRITTTTLFMLYSLPSFWVATLGIIYLCVGSGFIELFPTSKLHSNEYQLMSAGERFIDLLWHLILPMAVYTYGSFAFISRQMRGSMLEVVRQDYIRTARAKGLSERAVIYKHALRNSLIPIITLLAGLLPALIGGSVVVESIFSIPGMGQLAIKALLERDYPIIMGELTLSAILTLVGVLLADILYSVVDPRIAFSKKGS